jgi:cytoskeletal protein RodZ
MRVHRFLGRILVAVASMVAAALLAAPAISAVGSSAPAPDDTSRQTEQIEAASSSEPVSEPTVTPTPSPSTTSVPTSSPSPAPQQSTQPPQTTNGSSVENRVREVVGRVEDLVNVQEPPGSMDDCLIDIGGIGPINLCI